MTSVMFSGTVLTRILCRSSTSLQKWIGLRQIQIHFAVSVQQLLCRMSRAGQSTDLCSPLKPTMTNWAVSGTYLSRLMKWLLPIIRYRYEHSSWCATNCSGRWWISKICKLLSNYHKQDWYFITQTKEMLFL